MFVLNKSLKVSFAGSKYTQERVPFLGFSRQQRCAAKAAKHVHNEKHGTGSKRIFWSDQRQSNGQPTECILILVSHTMKLVF